MEEPHCGQGYSALPPSKFGAGYTVGDGVAEPSPPAYDNPMPYPPQGHEPPPPDYGNQVQYPPPPPEPPAPSAGPYSPMPGQYPVVVAPVGYLPAAKTNSMAIAALVSSLVLAPLGIVFGHIALSQIKRSGEDGRGLAIAGLVIGYIFTAILLLWVLFWAIVVGAAVNEINQYESEYSTYSMAVASPVFG
ncbi:DUF4190 domain-containing protein [Mycobacterium sp. 852014-52144_SCH5372336]|uniref:DUF4190 domain-containing protein n=1 Tax=Mycobacterium sp. 852014-52144_SCH5372336 TaxID=1834115 RepID=UPI0008003865|nr:DUF4190 domain-containing protein [Mycobacterium sp. 852014-52144_SCH5372336]OBB77400.1 hypothetical protein A5759_03930 [Mycobacterium sp. 852014-52144_SCH5372336]